MYINMGINKKYCKEVKKVIKYRKKDGWLFMKKGELQAVHDNDIETLLDSIGYLQKYENGEIRCIYCNNTITYDNFQCLIPDKNKVLFCCNNIECYKKTIKIAEV